MTRQAGWWKVGLLLLSALIVPPMPGHAQEENTQVRLTYVPNWAPIPGNQGMKWFANKSWMPATFQSQKAHGPMTIHGDGKITFEKSYRPWSYRVLAETPDFVLLFMRMDHTYPEDKKTDIRYSFVILAADISETYKTRDKLPPDYRPVTMHFFYCLHDYPEPPGEGGVQDVLLTREPHWNLPKDELLAFWHGNKQCNPVLTKRDTRTLGRYFPNYPGPNWGWAYYSELR
ncbi:MAG: hypothetical protein HQL45_17790 [Alphaproteobacteria bacterium]|nr:hypothetical protein [Alphaproteobacteria bacterium]